MAFKINIGCTLQLLNLSKNHNEIVHKLNNLKNIQIHKRQIKCSETGITGGDTGLAQRGY